MHSQTNHGKVHEELFSTHDTRNKTPLHKIVFLQGKELIVLRLESMKTLNSSTIYVPPGDKNNVAPITGRLDSGSS